LRESAEIRTARRSRESGREELTAENAEVGEEFTTEVTEITERRSVRGHENVNAEGMEGVGEECCRALPELGCVRAFSCGGGGGLAAVKLPAQGDAD
jgi:hypothetical protein